MNAQVNTLHNQVNVAALQSGGPCIEWKYSIYYQILHDFGKTLDMQNKQLTRTQRRVHQHSQSNQG